MITLIMFIGVKPNSAEPHTVLDEENCRLCITVLSDCHIEGNNLSRYNAFGTILKDAANNSFDNNVTLFLGDNTMNGQNIESLLFYGAVDRVRPSDRIITVIGNHDVGNGEGDYSKLLSRYQGYNSAFFGTTFNDDNPWRCEVVDGYYFIILAPQDLCVYEMPITDAQYEFLDEMLELATAEGKPAFVLCHYPIDDVDEDWGERAEEIVAKYDNVFWLGGHTHMPIIEGWTFSDAWGVNEVNLPRCTELAGSGDNEIYSGTGYGVQLEVYDNEVIGRARNYYTGEWEGLEYTFTLK